MSRFKTLDISSYWDDTFFSPTQKREFIIRKISFGEISKLQKQSVDARLVGTIQNVSFDIEKSRNMLVVAGIKNAPHLLLEDGNELQFVTGGLKYVENLPNALGQYLYDQIEEFNAPDPNV